MKTRRVALYGGNLLMSAIGARLQQKPEYQVQQIAVLLPEILDKMNADPPDAILFDLARAQLHFLIPLLRKHPKIMLIGVDLVVNEMLGLSGQQSRFLTVDVLVQVIEGGSSK